MKKLTLFLLAAVATLLLSTSTFARGVSVGVGHVNVGIGHNFGFGHNTFAVRAFTFSQPVYATANAYATYQPFALVAQPPVATVSYQAAQPCPQMAYNDLVANSVPMVTYATPTNSYSLFGGGNYGVSSGNYGVSFNRFGFNRFDVGFNRFGVGFNRFNVGFNRFGVGFNRFDVGFNRFNARFAVGADIAVRETRTVRGPFGRNVTRTRTIVK